MAAANVPGTSVDALPDGESPVENLSKKSGKRISALRHKMNKVALFVVFGLAVPLAARYNYVRQQEGDRVTQAAMKSNKVSLEHVKTAWENLSNPDTPLDELRVQWRVLLTHLTGFQRGSFMARNPHTMTIDVPEFRYEGPDILPDLLEGTGISPGEFLAIESHIKNLEKAAASSATSTNMQAPDSSLAQGQE